MRLVNSALHELVQRYRRAIMVVRDRGLPVPAYMARDPRAPAVDISGGEIDTRALDAAEARLRELDRVEKVLQTATDQTKAEIHRLRAGHAARRDRFFAEAEDMPLPPKPAADETPVAGRAGINGEGSTPTGAGDGRAQEITTETRRRFA